MEKSARLVPDPPRANWKRRQRGGNLENCLANTTLFILSDPLPPGGRLSDYQATMLYVILDRRYRECKPIWASVNTVGRDEADARIGAPLVDRLRDGALVLACNWPSHRKPWEGSEK